MSVIRCLYHLVLIFLLTFWDQCFAASINPNITTNETRILSNGSDICFDKRCPDGKSCFVDDGTSEGYKCCKNKKCSGKIRCKDPGEVENAEKFPEQPRKFRVSENVIYKCKSGSLMEITFAIQCSENGTWKNQVPVCTDEIEKNIGKSSPTLAAESTSINIKAEDPSSNNSVEIVIVLILLCFVGIAGALFFSYKNRNNHLMMSCRQRSHPVVLENVTFPTSPDKLEEGAVTINDFSQYVALGHTNADQKFREEFEDIQNQPIGALSWETSLLPDNQDKNRYINIVAYDHSRIRLKYSNSHRRSSSHHSTDYINGNFVSSFEKPKAYIACQGPMPNTFNEFWRMIWENNVTVIVMITNLVENGRRKCDQYWPHDGREQYKHVSVTLRDVDVYANYTVRSFQVRNTKQSRRRSRNNERRILQFHYTQWPDHGTPEYILPLLTFIRRSTIANNAESSPIVVHCSAGVGRTGAYIMLHSMMQMARTLGKININKFLRFIRVQRNYLVQTEDQYIFLHDALLCHFSCGNTEVPAQQLSTYIENLLSLLLQHPMSKEVTELKKDAEIGIRTTGKDDKIKMSPGHQRSGMQRQFMKVAQYVLRDVDYDFALRSVNQQKNRPNGVLPIFRSRVPLHSRAGVEGSDYINASFLQGYRNGRMFIVTQLPLQNTRKDFWQLVWDHNCSIVITIRDKDWNEMTDKYWPAQDHHIACPSFNVSFASENKFRQNEKIKLTVRDYVLEATKDDYVLAVTQLDISDWPNIDELNADFVQLLNTIVKYTDGKDASIIIQDRFGGTSAGQLACIHSLHQQHANENVVDVFQATRVAYQMRPYIFSAYSHLHFIYKAMLLQTNPSQFGAPERKMENKEKIPSSNGKSSFVKDELPVEKKPLLQEDESGDGDASCIITVSKTNHNELENTNVDDEATCPLIESNDQEESSLILNLNDEVTNCSKESNVESEDVSPTADIFKDINDSVASESAQLLKN